MRFVLRDDASRAAACEAVMQARRGSSVALKGPSRTLDQNALFHALCGALERSGLEWAGSVRSESDWKVLLVSGHAVATRHPAEIVVGLEGELVSLRESTALMDRARSSSLIDYALAFCGAMGVRA